MNKIRVNVAPPYDIVIERGALNTIGEYVRQVTDARCAFVITDTNVDKYYGDSVEKALQSVGLAVKKIVIPAGEQTKTADSYLSLIRMLAGMQVRRTDAIIALGGGVVGDLAGFAAATYMRGVDFIQVPTSLLAMIDSSIGGKTGVDLPEGKNLLGAFYQPKLVLADPDALKTLPEREWKNGMGEGIKYACLAGGKIARIMWDGLTDGNLEEFISLCAGYKASIVERDEKEGGLRKLLNLGHTLGHALEKESNFTVPHGMAVAQGIAWMAVAAYNNGDLCAEFLHGIIDMLQKNKLLSDNALTAEMFDTIRMDKKAESADIISVIVIKRIGLCTIKNMTFDGFKEYVLKGI